MKNKPIIIGIIVLFIIVVVGLVYAVFTQDLNINGTGNVRNSKWDIYFTNLTNIEHSGTSTLTVPAILDNKSTTVGDYTATITSPGDYVSFEVDVKNDGDYDALLSGLTLGTPVCKYNNDATDTSALNVCNNLTYTIKYKGGASLIPNTDILHSKETQTLVVELRYANITDPTLLPTHDIDITGLGITLTYVQSGNALVNNDGTTPWVDPYSHHVGDRIQVAGDISNSYYRVIANSPTNDDYVVALKEEPLTKMEIDNNHYGQGYINLYNDYSRGTVYNSVGYGGVAYYSSATCGYDDSGKSITSGCASENATNYASSHIKHVVDDWEALTFEHSELKNVDGYTARLAKIEELQPIGCPNCTSTGGCSAESSTPSWFYSNVYWYWTMSQYNNSSSKVWIVIDNGGTSGYGVFNFFAAVRPVINVYKSKIAN